MPRINTLRGGCVQTVYSDSERSREQAVSRLPELESAATDMDAMAVEQEYRLILLELGAGE